MMEGRAAPMALIAAGALAACSTMDDAHAGSGWSRAPDLSVYGAMEMYGGIAREQSILCQGFRTEVVRTRWRDDFGARADAVESALVARHGAEAVQRAALYPSRRVACPNIPDMTWRVQYARLLRLLETRMGIAG
ncbi:MAG: hypothetical protein AB7O91_03675 [Sphingomonas sp.]